MSKSYKVNSDRLNGRQVGDVVTADDFPTANIEALVQGGHLIPISAVKKQDEKDK